MYKVETLIVNGGLFKDAYDKAPSKLEDKLNEGAKKGWKLHSFQESVALVQNKGLAFIIVWEVNK